jgi:biopolymer transport protein ExbB/TolQ
MSAFFAQMGIWAYPMLLVALLLVVQIIRVMAGLQARARGRGSPSGGTILVWGALAGVLGFLGTAVGISLAAGVIETAPSLSPGVIAGGVKVALSTTVFGLVLFASALVAWLVVRLLEGRLKSPAT